MKERLQKLISGAGFASRRAAEELIKAGRVRVNGEPASLGMSADPDTDVVTVDGKRLRQPEERVYIMLNKPRGYVTTLSDEKGRKTVAELVLGVGRRLYPVGRLDLNSEGLLIMTDDGEAANALMHPSHEVSKTYRVTVSGAGAGDRQCAGWRQFASWRASPSVRPRRGWSRRERTAVWCWTSPSTRGETGRCAGCAPQSGWRCADSCGSRRGS
ncbi:MAG: pseudouridine synthase [Lachnospiraceae bacterium]